MKINLSELRCLRCSHTWVPRRPDIRVCPKCHSPYWDRGRCGTSKTVGQGDLLKEILGRIVKGFDPEKIILFGSRAKGTAGPDSDVDLLVVMRVEDSRRKKAAEIDAALVGIPLPIDLIVVDPKQVAEGPDHLVGVVRAAALEGKVIYEKAA